MQVKCATPKIILEEKTTVLKVIILFSQPESELGSFSPDDIKDFSPPQVVEFLAQLVDKVKKHKTYSLFLIPPDIQLLVS